jgi:endoglucanase
MKLPILTFFISTIFCAGSLAQKSADIRLNQVGFYPKAEKLAVVLTTKESPFTVTDLKTNKIVFKGRLGQTRQSQHSGKNTRIADFSPINKPGNYRLEIADQKKSALFELKEDVYREIAVASLRGFYFQRMSTALPEKYAGKWARPAGHPDDQVLIHPSAVSAGRPENFVIKSPGGWYDAGDYNKYIVNSGITMGTLLSLCEDHPEYFDNLNTNIPESNDAIPDLLDEVLYNLRWMLTMQDPADGGVYHKLTNSKFDGMVMPVDCNKPRYVVQKSTAATLDFVSVMAQSARIFKHFETQLPGLSDSCTTAAVKSWNWAKENPNLLYEQEEINKKFIPDIQTGTYGDRNVSDEWIWASSEMYALTGKSEYIKNVDFQLDKPMSLPGWNQVKTLGYYTILRAGDRLKPEGSLLADIKKSVTAYATDLIADLNQQPYHTVMGKKATDYAWGSSSVAANQGIALLYAYSVSKNPEFLKAAAGNFDYLLGRNATDYSFLTGFGTKRVMHPHHRLAVADGIVDPMPGQLSGGPNPGQQDKCTTYPNKFADESFTDDDRSYASNEIAINWNAPLVYLAAALDALSKTGN